MVEDKLKKVAKYIIENSEESRKEIYESIDYVKDVFEESYNKLVKDLHDSAINKDIDKSNKILEILNCMKDITEFLKQSSSYFYLDMNKSSVLDQNLDEAINYPNYNSKFEVISKDMNEENDLPDLNESETEEIDEKNNPINYDLYKVDSRKKHTLSEDYEHKRVCGFIFRGAYFETKTMKDLLIMLCSILYDNNKESFEKLLLSPLMRGRKNRYLSYDKVIEKGVEKNVKIPKSDIYVWVNLSCNSIIELIRRIFLELKISENDLSIFLRADYSSLHKEISEDNDDEFDKELEKKCDKEKIGSYVYKKMKLLSNNNFKFKYSDLANMESSKWSRDNIGLYNAFIKKCNNSMNESFQKNTNSCLNYWKEVFIFNGQKYFVTNQWYERHRENFDKWFNLLGK